MYPRLAVILMLACLGSGAAVLGTDQKESAASVRAERAGEGIRWAWLPELGEIPAEPAPSP